MREHPWRLALGGMAALASGLGVGRFVYTPILPAMAEALNLTNAQAGLIASANFAGYLAGALLAAAPKLRGSRRVYLLAALGVNALTLAGMGLSDVYTAHLAIRFISGLASAFVLVFASALVLDRLAASGHHGLSAVYFAGVGTGISISALAVAALAAAGSGWKGFWLASGVLGLAGFVLVAALVPEAPPQLVSRDMPGRASASSALRAIIAAYGLFGFGYVITATFIVAIVRAAPEIRAMEPAIWVLFGLSAVPSVALWMWIAARLGPLGAFAAACLVQAAGVAASVMWISTSGVLVAVLCLGGTFMGLTALGLIAARSLSAGDPRSNFAFMTAAFGVGQLIGPAFAGALFDRLGSFTAPTLIASGALIVAAGLAGLAATISRRAEAVRASP